MDNRRIKLFLALEMPHEKEAMEILLFLCQAAPIGRSPLYKDSYCIGKTVASGFKPIPTTAALEQMILTKRASEAKNE